LSRADPRFVIKLFQLEVSEINDGTIEIKGIAREPGFRTKLAVWTRDEKVDPVGACVGLRGQRVKNIVRELNNEKVDIIRWDPNVKVFITNALAPAKLKAYAEMHGTGPGWLFLTGNPQDVELLRRKLGWVDLNPEVDKDKSRHSGMIRFGNEPLAQWAACQGQASPEWMAEEISFVIPRGKSAAARL